MTLEIPDLINKLRQQYEGNDELTIRTGWFLKWDVTKAQVTVVDGDDNLILTQKLVNWGLIYKILLLKED